MTEEPLYGTLGAALDELHAAAVDLMMHYSDDLRPDDLAKIEAVDLMALDHLEVLDLIE